MHDSIAAAGAVAKNLFIYWYASRARRRTPHSPHYTTPRARQDNAAAASNQNQQNYNNRPHAAPPMGTSHGFAYRSNVGQINDIACNLLMRSESGGHM